MDDIENVCRGMLHRSAAREYAVSQAAPEAPSTDYLTGFAAGQLEGQVTTAAIFLALLLDESPTKVLENARTQAAVEAAFPFDLHIEGA